MSCASGAKVPQAGAQSSKVGIFSTPFPFRRIMQSSSRPSAVPRNESHKSRNHLRRCVDQTRPLALHHCCQGMLVVCRTFSTFISPIVSSGVGRHCRECFSEWSVRLEAGARRSVEGSVGFQVACRVRCQKRLLPMFGASNRALVQSSEKVLSVVALTTVLSAGLRISGSNPSCLRD